MTNELAWTAAEAARHVNVSRTTLMRRLDAGEITGATQDSTGRWRIPPQSLAIAGLLDAPATEATEADTETPGAEQADSADQGTTELQVTLARLQAELDAERAMRKQAEQHAAKIEQHYAAHIADLQTALRAIEPPKPTTDTPPHQQATEATTETPATEAAPSTPRPGFFARLRQSFTG